MRKILSHTVPTAPSLTDLYQAHKGPITTSFLPRQGRQAEMRGAVEDRASYKGNQSSQGVGNGVSSGVCASDEHDTELCMQPGV